MAKHRTMYLWSFLGKRHNYKALRDAQCQNVKYYFSHYRPENQSVMFIELNADRYIKTV